MNVPNTLTILAPSSQQIETQPDTGPDSLRLDRFRIEPWRQNMPPDMPHRVAVSLEGSNLITEVIFP